MASLRARDAATARTRFERLSRQDLANLIVEAPDTPMHMAVLMVFDGRSLSVSAPADLVRRVRLHVGRRLDRIPELRQVLHHAAPPAGPPLWVDDPRFRIHEHVMGARVPPPGREAELLATCQDLLERLLDRSRPLWELWVLTGLEDHRFAVLLKLHHAVTDGAGMVRIAEALFDASARVPLKRAAPWIAWPPPSWARLSAVSVADATRELWRLSTVPVHPVQLVQSAGGLATTVASIAGRTWAGRRARLRRPIGPHRRLAVVRLDLQAVKGVAHAHGAKVNDVVLELAADGVRGALESRGEPVRSVVLRALMAVNPASGAVSGGRNRAASVMVCLPLETASSSDRLCSIAADSRRSRRWQRAGVVERSMVLVTRTRLGRFLSRHQGVIDLAVSNVRGPAQPLYLMGCRMLDAIPVTPISGNVTIDFCALSYAKRFDIGILADAAAWPDLAVVAREMRAGWKRLARATVQAAAVA